MSKLGDSRMNIEKGELYGDDDTTVQDTQRTK